MGILVHVDAPVERRVRLGGTASLEDVKFSAVFRIRKQSSHNVRFQIAAMPHNFSSWRTTFRIAENAFKLLNLMAFSFGPFGRFGLAADVDVTNLDQALSTTHSSEFSSHAITDQRRIDSCPREGLG
jgi:hypothetical protein